MIQYCCEILDWGENICKWESGVSIRQKLGHRLGL